ncbi:DDE_3 domain-containing protein [Trichonephila clavipes]|nr:DDE_3 domain-containing protein [Trichonephila clavipes]
MGRGSRVVKVSDRGLPGHEFEPSTTKDPPSEQCDVNIQSINLNADDQRIRAWRRPGHRSHPVFVERHTTITLGVTGWGVVCRDTRLSLVVLQSTCTARSYEDEILASVVLPMLSCHPGAIYRQDNVRSHTPRLSQQCLQGYDVLSWPAMSPNLSRIEMVWTVLERQLQPSRNAREYPVQLQRLWHDFSHVVTRPY